MQDLPTPPAMKLQYTPAAPALFANFHRCRTDAERRRKFLEFFAFWIVRARVLLGAVRRDLMRALGVKR